MMTASRPRAIQHSLTLKLVPQSAIALALLGKPVGPRQHPQLGGEAAGVGDAGEEAVDHGGPWGGSLCALMSRNA